MNDPDNPLKLKTEYQNKLYWERIQKELKSEVTHLNELAKSFVEGSDRPKMKSNLQESSAKVVGGSLIIEGQQVMQDWQVELMKAVVEAIDPAGKNVLEIGYGLGIASEFIQKLKPTKHTIIECNSDVFKTMQNWAGTKDTDIALVEARWQDTLPDLGEYEVILFDPYPFDETEFQSYWYDDGNFDAHFFPYATKHLVDGGTFSYFSNEIDSLSRIHQRQLLEHFSKFEVKVVKNLKPPEDCQYWWANTMAVVRATK